MCTDFILPFDKDTSIISARTMDFVQSPTLAYDTFVVKAPCNLTFTANAPKGAKGHSWQNTYGFVGFYMAPTPAGKAPTPPVVDPAKLYFSDGMNTQGLSAAVLWLSYTDYEHPAPGDESRCIDIENLVSFLLGTCASIEEVIENLADILVWLPEQLEILMPYHLSVHDRAGKSLVIDFSSGKKIYYNNDEIGVLTNGPTYDWQATHLNYLYNSLTCEDNGLNKFVQLQEKNGRQYVTSGTGYQYEVLGAGMLGLPGDSTSPSRFVRAAKLRQTLPRTYSSREGVQYALQILGRIAVCHQEVLVYFNGDGTKADPMNSYDRTLWMTVRNHTDKILYYASAQNHNIQAINLTELDFSEQTSPTMSSISTGSWFVDSTEILA